MKTNTTAGIVASIVASWSSERGEFDAFEWVFVANERMAEARATIARASLNQEEKTEALALVAESLGI